MQNISLKLQSVHSKMMSIVNSVPRVAVYERAYESKRIIIQLSSPTHILT